MSYTEQAGVIVNLLPWEEYESKYWAGTLTEGEAWIPTDLINHIPTYNTDLKQRLGTIKANTSSYSTMKSSEVVYISERTSEANITVERINHSSSKSYVYTIIAEVGNTPYTIRLFDYYAQAYAVLNKWRNGDSLYTSNGRIQLQANKTYIITINNGLASYEVYS